MDDAGTVAHFTLPCQEDRFVTLPAHRYKDRPLPLDAEDVTLGGHRYNVDPLDVAAIEARSTPLARTLRRAHRAVRAQERSSDLPGARVGDSASETRADVTAGAGNWAIDLDGVLDSFPREMGSLVAALTAAGRHVYIITGIDEDTVAAKDVEAKRDFLTSLGVGPDTYYQLIVIPQPHPENKAQALKDNDCGVLVDNNRENIRAATAEGVVGLYLYNTREH